MKDALVPLPLQRWDWQAAADHQAAQQCDQADGCVCWDRQQVCSAQGIGMNIVLQWLHHSTGYQRAPPATCMAPAHVLLKYHFPATARNSFHLTYMGLQKLLRQNRE